MLRVGGIASSFKSLICEEVDVVLLGWDAMWTHRYGTNVLKKHTVSVFRAEVGTSYSSWKLSTWKNEKEM
jgi:hypothetical protein